MYLRLLGRIYNIDILLIKELFIHVFTFVTLTTHSDFDNKIEKQNRYHGFILYKYTNTTVIERICSKLDILLSRQ